MKYPNIEAERARLGMSKESFAKKMKISTKPYYNWINGTNPIPSDVLIEMAELCDSSTDYLLGLSDVKPRRELIVKSQNSKTYT